MFKKGDKVRRIQGGHEGMKVGDVAVVKFDQLPGDMRLNLVGYNWVHDSSNFELVDTTKEDTTTWLKENAWYVRVSSEDEFNLVKDWLNDMNIMFPFGTEYDNMYSAIGSDGYGHAKDSCIRLCEDEMIMYGRELKPQFKLTLEDIILPETPKKTEQQLKLEALEATIQKAQQEIQQLKEMK